MAKLMRMAGCRLVSIGIESGSQEMLNKMEKKITLAQSKGAIKILKKADLASFANYIVGLPWETKETIEETVRFSIELDSDYANFFIAAPLPGTKFYEYAVQNNLFSQGESNKEELYDNSYVYPIAKGHYLDRNEIVKLQRKATRHFIYRPKYIFKTFKSIHSLNELKRYLKYWFINYL